MAENKINNVIHAIKPIKRFGDSPKEWDNAGEVLLAYCLWNSREAFKKVSAMAKLKESYFYDYQHFLILECAKSLYQEGLIPNWQAVKERFALKERKEIDQGYWLTLWDRLCCAVLDQYSDKILRRFDPDLERDQIAAALNCWSDVTLLIDRLMEVGKEARKSSLIADAIMSQISADEMQKGLVEIDKDYEDDPTLDTSIQACLQREIEYYLDLENGKKPLKYPTGYTDLDALINGGLSPQGVYYVVARPGEGKTSFGINLFSNIAINPQLVTTDENIQKAERPSVFVSLELSKEQLMKSLMSCLSGLFLNILKEKSPLELRKDLSNRYKEAYDHAANSNVHILDNSYRNVASLEAKLEEIAMEYQQQHQLERPELGIIVIDYMQLMTAELQGIAFDHQRIAAASNKLVEIAKKFNCVIVGLCQLRRSYQPKNKTKTEGPSSVTLDDIKDSGQLEQDAQVVIALETIARYNKEKHSSLNVSYDDVRLTILKNRFGETGELVLYRSGANGRYRNNTNQYVKNND